MNGPDARTATPIAGARHGKPVLTEVLGRTRARLLVCGVTWIALLAIGLWARARSDYMAYIAQWERVLGGANPWAGDPTNAYGPGHQLLAALYAVHPLVPKLAFILCWFACFAIIVAERRSRAVEAAVFLALFASPFFIILIGLYGANDALVALLVLLAVDLKTRKGQRTLPAILLVLAASTKLYPIALLPFLATERGRIDWRFLWTALGAVAAAAAATTAAWGLSALYIFEFAFEREGKMLSIFWFLYDSRFSPLFRTAAGAALMDWNIVVVGTAMAALWALHVLGALRALSGTLLAIVGLLAFYKVGNPPYFICAAMLLIYFLARNVSQFGPERPLLLAAVCYLGVLNVFQLWYWLTNTSMQYPGVRAFIGLPCFAAGLFLMWRIIVREFDHRAGDERVERP